jgi:hypothetical protein
MNWTNSLNKIFPGSVKGVRILIFFGLLPIFVTEISVWYACISKLIEKGNSVSIFSHFKLRIFGSMQIYIKI